MMIALVDDGDSNRGAREFLRGGQPSEASSNDDHMVQGRPCLITHVGLRVRAAMQRSVNDLFISLRRKTWPSCRGHQAHSSGPHRRDFVVCQILEKMMLKRGRHFYTITTETKKANAHVLYIITVSEFIRKTHEPYSQQDQSVTAAAQRQALEVLA